MKYQIKSGAFIVLMILTIKVYSADSLKVNSFNSYKILSIENSWLKTGNSSGLVFNQNSEFVNFNVGADIKGGDFHRIRESSELTKYSFNTSSYQSVDDRFFTYGKFEYNNLAEKNARWTGVYDAYNGNPYILADSLSGTTWRKENYNLTGKLAYILPNKVVIGCGVDYYVAVAAKQKDPRPHNVITFFEINPSVILIRENYKLGFDLGYSNRKEEIEYDTERDNFSPTFFFFKGMGFYSKEVGTGFDRFQSERKIFGGAQLDKELVSWNSLSELRFSYSSEKIEDGSSTIVREDGGDWVTYKVELKEQLKKVLGKNIHLVDGEISFFNGDGTEYTQNKVMDGDVTRYVTIAKNLKFNRQVVSGKIAYNYLRMLDKSKIDWDIMAAADVINKAEEYYYVPEIFSSSYLNVSGMAEIQKNFYFGKIQLAPAINASYTSNISNSLLLSNLAEITKNQRPEIYTQDFEYYSADLLKMGGKIQLGYCPQNIKSIDQINLNLMVDYWKPIELETNTTFISAKIGFVF